MTTRPDRDKPPAAPSAPASPPAGGSSTGAGSSGAERPAAATSSGATSNPAASTGADHQRAAPATKSEATSSGTEGSSRPSGGPGEALAAALDRVGDRWSLLLVDALLDGPRRFGELGEAVPGIAPNILSDRLRRLERAALVRSTPYSARPPRMEYGLTVAGRELAGVIRLLADWGARQAGEAPGIAAPRHETCGTPLEARWWCPTCGGPADDVDAEGLTRL